MSTAGEKRPLEGGDDGGGKRPATEVAAAATEEEDKCWICHDTESESGQPLRRDCSCRGSAGFAHLRCIVEYAKNKSEQNENNFVKFRAPWTECPNCKQMYQNKLQYGLANEFATFAETKYTGNKVLYFSSLEVKMKADETPKEETIAIANKILSTIDEMEANGSSLSNEVKLFRADAHLRVGVRGCNGSEADAITHLEQAKEIYNEIGQQRRVCIVETRIAGMNKEGGRDERKKNQLAIAQMVYTEAVRRGGEETNDAIMTGVSVAKALKNVYRGIEAERRAMKILSVSSRVNGQNHKCTQEVKKTLKAIKTRLVRLRSLADGQVSPFLALRYEEDGTKCVLRGPISMPRRAEDEKTFTVQSEDIGLGKGLPVICNGLKQSTHLNGKIGDIRAWAEGGAIYRVHFEDADLGAVAVRKKFLQVLFDLPEEQVM